MHATKSAPAAVYELGGPIPSCSREGRCNQRYGKCGEKLVAGCLPFRFTKNENGEETVEVLMIRRGFKGWVFPKGGWEDDEEVETAARREAVEEAGVRGFIEGPLLGAYEFQTAKANSVHKGKTVAYMFVLHVSEVLDPWPEAGDRTREWFSLLESGQQCSYQWMRDALLQWVTRRGWNNIAAQIAALPQRHERSSIDLC